VPLRPFNGTDTPATLLFCISSPAGEDHNLVERKN